MLTGSIPEGKYYDKTLEAKVENGSVDVVEINKEMKIDNDTIFIQRLIIDEGNIYLRYSTEEEKGWSFSDSALALYDDKGNYLSSSGGGSSEKSWGRDGLIEFEKAEGNCKELTLKLEWYDRQGELKIPLKEGEL
jgi:hypothetical protein